MEEKKTIGEIMRSRRERAGLEIKDVLEKLKEYDIYLSDKSISAYERNTRQMKISTFAALCDIYNVKDPFCGIHKKQTNCDIPTDEEWVLIEQFRNLDSYGHKAVRSILSVEEECCKESIENIVYMRPVGYYQRSVSAGTGLVLLDGIPVDTINIPIKEEYKNVAYAVGVNGSSMEPLYFDNDVLLVEAVSDIRTGDIGIFYVSGEAYVKKLGESALISLNPAYDPIPLTVDTQCKGRVIDAIRKDF